MYFRKFNITKKFRVFIFFVLLSFMLCANKYSSEKFNTNNLGKTAAEAIMKNFAMNLLDTKFLKITNRQMLEQNEELLGNKFTNGDVSMLTNLRGNLGYVNKNMESKNVRKSKVLSGSVLVNNKGELSFLNYYIDEDNQKILKGRKLIARARYTKSLAEIGWSRLFVETFDNSSPEILSWAAGYLEGKLCSHEILDFYNNLIGIHSKETMYLNDVFDYYKKVEEFIRAKTSKHHLATLNQGKDLEYWISVAMTQAQTDGLLAGYNTIMKDEGKIMNLSQIYFLNADGEVPELLSVFKVKKEYQKMFGTENFSFRQENTIDKFSKEFLKKYFGTSDPEMVWNKLMQNSHCSAVIKLLKNEDGSFKDILIGHTTWDSYSEMHRIFKVYKFAYTMYGEEKKNSNIAFSSYPGTLTSTDDFYVLNNKLVVTETTLEMLDRSLYENKIPNAEEHVPNYIRISVANRLANSGKEWTEIFKQNNSGTYNSQWMIFDFSSLHDGAGKDTLMEYFDNRQVKKDETFKSVYDGYFSFKERIGNISRVHNRNKKQPTGVFYVLEQIPGWVEIQDMTSLLFSKGYWASYNRPYFKRISKDAGYDDMLIRYGKTYSYEDNPRAQLILSRIHEIEDVESLKSLMQNNSNISGTDHVNTISPRYDLATRPEIRKSAGGIDSKIVNIDLVLNGIVIAISGPSAQNNASPFTWADYPDEPHFGLPDYWNFDWVKFDEKFVKNDIPK